MICFDGVAERDNFILQLTLSHDLVNLANVVVVAESLLPLALSDLLHS